MTIKEIQYITTIAELGSYSRAAERLYVSQPALSQAVRKLEIRLGVQLLTRSDGQIILTPAGRIFAENGADVLNAEVALEERMHEISGQHQEDIRLGISQFYSLHHLSRFLPLFVKSFPNNHVRITEDSSINLEEMISQGSLDIAFVPFPIVTTTIEYEVLHREEIFLAVPPNHPLSALSRSHNNQRLPFISLSVTQNEPYIFLDHMRFTDQAHKLCEEAGFKPNIRYETKNWDTAHEYVRRGLGVAFIPEILIPKETSVDGPSYFRINSKYAFRPYAAIYRNRDKLSEAAVHMIEIAREVFAESSDN